MIRFEKTNPIFGSEKERKCLFERVLWELLRFWAVKNKANSPGFARKS